VSLVKADTDKFKRIMDNKAVKKTLTIPYWLDEEAKKANVNFSGILQDALKSHLHIQE
jgi:post-segregation antitoxin (ccd killing protein)